METSELKLKIEGLVKQARQMAEEQQLRSVLLTTPWLDDLPLAQFVELCDAFEHDDVNAGTYPSTWLRFGPVQVRLNCDRVLNTPIRVPSGLEILRQRLQQSAAA